MIGILLLELIIAQSPDKMKGLMMGMALAFRGFVTVISIGFRRFTLCLDLSIS